MTIISESLKELAKGCYLARSEMAEFFTLPVVEIPQEPDYNALLDALNTMRGQ